MPSIHRARGSRDGLPLAFKGDADSALVGWAVLSLPAALSQEKVYGFDNYAGNGRFIFVGIIGDPLGEGAGYPNGNLFGRIGTGVFGQLSHGAHSRFPSSRKMENRCWTARGYVTVSEENCNLDGISPSGGKRVLSGCVRRDI